SDPGVGPAESRAITIQLEAEQIREAAVAVGDSIRLTVELRDNSGGGVLWEVEDPTVASLGGAIGAEVTVHGESFGSTRVTATAGVFADTVIISVLSAGSGGWCDAGGLSLSVGQSVTTAAGAASPLC